MSVFLEAPVSLLQVPLEVLELEELVDAELVDAELVDAEELEVPFGLLGSNEEDELEVVAEDEVPFGLLGSNAEAVDVVVAVELAEADPCLLTTFPPLDDKISLKASVAVLIIDPDDELELGLFGSYVDVPELEAVFNERK